MAVVVAFAVATLLGLFALWRSARAAVTICVIEVEGGRAQVTEGQLAPRVLSDVIDIVKRPTVSRATLRVTRARDLARLDARGALTPDQLQQLRNVIGNVPIAKLLGGRKAKG